MGSDRIFGAVYIPERDLGFAKSVGHWNAFFDALIYPYVQKNFVKGVMIGAIKG